MDEEFAYVNPGPAGDGIGDGVSDIGGAQKGHLRLLRVQHVARLLMTDSLA